MRKLIESVLVSLDGVTRIPERWADFDAEDTELAHEQLGHYDAFVMGRVTYENFYANWGHTSGNAYIDLINAMPKYVASRSLTETRWNATLLGPDAARPTGPQPKRGGGQRSGTRPRRPRRLRGRDQALGAAQAEFFGAREDARLRPAPGSSGAGPSGCGRPSDDGPRQPSAGGATNPAARGALS